MLKIFCRGSGQYSKTIIGDPYLIKNNWLEIWSKGREKDSKIEKQRYAHTQNSHLVLSLLTMG